MSDTPFMPLWVADFIKDTLDLEAKEVGAYMLLLMAMWGRGGRLPNDQTKLKRVARVGRDWPKVWASIEHYFTVEGDTITQSRLLKEYTKVAAKREVNAQSGARGGRAKALKSKDAGLANATVSLKQSEPEPEIEAKASIKTPPKKSRLPEGWVPSEAMIEHARSQQISDTDIQEIANDFQIYWIDRRDRDASKSERGWEQTWKNRIKDIGWKYARNSKVAFGSGSGGHGQGGSIASLAARRRASGEV